MDSRVIRGDRLRGLSWCDHPSEGTVTGHDGRTRHHKYGKPRGSLSHE